MTGVVDLDTLAEWLRRQPAKLVGFARTDSSPVGVGYEIAEERVEISIFFLHHHQLSCPA